MKHFRCFIKFNICHWIILNKHNWKHQETKRLGFFIGATLMGYFSGLSRCKKESFLFSVSDLPNDSFKCSQKRRKKKRSAAFSSNVCLGHRVSQNQNNNNNKKTNPILSPDNGCIQASPTCYLSRWQSKIFLVLLKSLDHVLNCSWWARSVLAGAA